MLPTSALTWMRGLQEQLMPGTVVIYRMAQTSDGMGGLADGWAAVGTVSGRIYPVNQRGNTEFVAGAQVISETKWYATLPVGTQITARDRVVSGGRSWEVVKVNNDEDWQTAVRAELSAHNEENRT